MADQTLILGDALAELPKLESETYDLVIADPPYNLGKDFGNSHDSQSFEEYLGFTQRWLFEAYRLLKPTGTIYVFMGFRFIAYLYSLLERELGMHFNSWIVWHYTQGVGKTKGFSPRHDDILMFTKTKDFVFNLDAVRIPQKYYRQRNNMRGANPGDVWEFSHVHYCHTNRQSHPTQKPEGLIERLILASSNEYDKVLDPFVGSGTTLRVCQQLERIGTGIELNPDYVEKSAQRLNSDFDTFDSLDPRMKRIPQDLHNEEIRHTYLENHKQWFLKNHQDAEADFDQVVAKLYPDKPQVQEQIELL